MSSSKAPLAIVAVALLLAIVLGVLGSVLGVKITLLLLAGALPLPIILRDYRIGVMLLVVLLPSSTMLPPIIHQESLSPPRKYSRRVLFFARDAQVARSPTAVR